MDPVTRKMKQRSSAELLAAPSLYRWVEIGSLLTWTTAMVWQGWRLWPYLGQQPLVILAAAVVAYLEADFISGFVHWMGDTWGSPETPLVGSSLIRPFREHHVDEKAITRHGFVETNGSNSLFSLPAVLMTACVPMGEGPNLGVRVFLAAMFMFLMAWVMATNQFHKWSHADRPPVLIGWLQRAHLVLPPVHHSVHHQAPFEKYYCITAGWLNWPLTKIRFFPTLERLITALTGALPRKDDLGEAAAAKLVELTQQEPTSATPTRTQLEPQ